MDYGWMNGWIDGWKMVPSTVLKQDTILSRVHFIFYDLPCNALFFSCSKRELFLALCYLRIFWSYETSIHLNIHSPLSDPFSRPLFCPMLSNYPLESTMAPIFD
jgi:hypothetical protein